LQNRYARVLGALHQGPKVAGVRQATREASNEAVTREFSAPRTCSTTGHRGGDDVFRSGPFDHSFECKEDLDRVRSRVRGDWRTACILRSRNSDLSFEPPRRLTIDARLLNERGGCNGCRWRLSHLRNYGRGRGQVLGRQLQRPAWRRPELWSYLPCFGGRRRSHDRSDRGRRGRDAHLRADERRRS
jgi:hypothetical protein